MQISILRKNNLKSFYLHTLVSIMYFQGEGTNYNLPEAIKWLTKAADNNNFDAIESLELLERKMEEKIKK